MATSDVNISVKLTECMNPLYFFAATERNMLVAGLSDFRTPIVKEVAFE
jgi:hypothetical protein